MNLILVMLYTIVNEYYNIERRGSPCRRITKLSVLENYGIEVDYDLFDVDKPVKVNFPILTDDDKLKKKVLEFEKTGVIE